MTYQYVTQEFPTEGIPPTSRKGTAARGRNQGGGKQEKSGKRRQGFSTKNVFLAQETSCLQHHAGHPHRRPKTIAELIAGHEFIELYDRANPGRLARGGAL